MARAMGPERRLLAIYTGGTIGMRSEGGGKSVPPRPKQNNLRAGPLGTLGLSLERGERTLSPLGALVAGAPALERVRGRVNVPDLKLSIPEAMRLMGGGGTMEGCSVLCLGRWEGCWNIPHLLAYESP